MINNKQIYTAFEACLVLYILYAVFFIFMSTANAETEVYSTAYGVQRDVNFELYDYSNDKEFINSIDFSSGSCATFACCKIVKDGVVSACTTNPSAVTNGGYTMTIPAAALQGKQVSVRFDDAAGSPRFVSKRITFTTYDDTGAWHNQVPDVNVVDLAVAALKKFATQDTGEVNCVNRSVCKLSRSKPVAIP